MNNTQVEETQENTNNAVGEADAVDVAAGVVGEEVQKETIVLDENTVNMLQQKETVNPVVENQKLIDYEEIDKTFTDIFTNIETFKIENDADITIIDSIQTFVNMINDLNKEYTKEKLLDAINYCFSYFATYIKTFSGEDSYLGLLTNKKDSLLYDLIGNVEEITDTTVNFVIKHPEDTPVEDLYKGLFNIILFNLGNVAALVTTIRCSIKILELKENQTTLQTLTQMLERIK